MAAFHVTASSVVVVHELRNDVVQVPLTKQDELEKTLVFYSLNESFDPAVGPYLRLRPIGMMRCDRFV